jgi:hypothetical protein
MKGRTKNILMLTAVVVLIYVLFSMGNGKSRYSITERTYASLGGDEPSDSMAAAPVSRSECNMQKGTGLASSLLPREIASQEDFGQFAPDDILAGQSYLEPRQQIGFPETVGGSLRNANRTVRVDPPNPKQAYVWNNTTIVPDTMQRGLCA